MCEINPIISMIIHIIENCRRGYQECDVFRSNWFSGSAAVPMILAAVFAGFVAAVHLL